MRNKVSLRITIFTACTIIFAASIFYACRRQEVLIKSHPINEAQARAWLQKNGLAYKNETISVQTTEGKWLTATLNWRQAQQYNWQGRDYIDVPFQFDATQTSGNFGARFNLVVRSKGNEFEGAIRIETPDLRLADFDDGGGIVQQYEMLDGKRANIWFSKEDYTNAQAAFVQNITPAQYAQQKIEQVKNDETVLKPGLATVARKLTTICDSKWVTTYSGNCNYSVGDHVYVRLCRHDYYITTCETYDDGTGEGGGGGGYPPAPQPTQPQQPDPKPDPCDEAKKAADSLKKALAQSDVRAQLNKLIQDHKNSSNEYGFGIYKNADGSYGFTEIATSNSSNSLEFSFDASLNIVALVHTHPPGSSAIHSSTDIYGLNNYINKTDFAGSIVTHGDDVHLLSITDVAKYRKFYEGKENDYDKNDPTGWKVKSKMNKNFYSFSKDLNSANYDGADVTFPTQLYLMDEAKMGVSLQKYNTTNNSFQVKSLNIERKDINTIVPGSNSPYLSVTVDDGC
ncbi:hypothetical protein ABDK00_012345 [Niabella insulamsoli]|uniref:hypothetical protein n=1 Tax=Niabella insulamsoli TaxID=3144874 RepID=UPI0031FBDCF0